MRGPLISAEALARRLCTCEPPTLLDVRWTVHGGADREAYLDGHLPGAVFVDLDAQLADPPSARGRHPLPSARRFSEQMQRLGVSQRRPVVVYDSASGMAAARAWWLLRYFGHPDASVLDGGFAAWRACAGAIESDLSAPAPGDFVARPGAMPVVDAQEAARVASTGVLIDARAHERFLGITEPIDPVAGHIPGARNRPTTENVEADGKFRRPGALRVAFEQLGVGEGSPIAAYCGSGITAAHEVLALELAGYRAALYPGSWSEWVSDAARPVARADGA